LDRVGSSSLVAKKREPHRRLAVGFSKSLFVESEPNRLASQQQRALKQQSVLQFAIHANTNSGFLQRRQIESCHSQKPFAAEAGFA
jgi:hypothetical protein